MRDKYWVKMLRDVGEKKEGQFYQVSDTVGFGILISGAGNYFTDKEYEKEIEKEKQNEK